MTRKISISGLRILLLFALAMLLLSMYSHAQIWKKISDGSKKIQDAATHIATTTAVVSNSVKVMKHSWKKDTSANIRYQQVPDYRNREEVNINKKQSLVVENGQFKNLTWDPVTKFDNQLFPSF